MGVLPVRVIHTKKSEMIRIGFNEFIRRLEPASIIRNQLVLDYWVHRLFVHFVIGREPADVYVETVITEGELWVRY